MHVWTYGLGALLCSQEKKIAPGLNVLIFFYVIGRQKLALLPQPIRDTKLPLIPSRSLAFLAVQ